MKSNNKGPSLLRTAPRVQLSRGRTLAAIIRLLTSTHSVSWPQGWWTRHGRKTEGPCALPLVARLLLANLARRSYRTAPGVRSSLGSTPGAARTVTSMPSTYWRLGWWILPGLSMDGHSPRPAETFG